mmetsp:Transcript_22262/g.31337  ORF Transcript_22262/g.31337 Transcript_22262/m.31337 type:complete len:2224 (-) Transcript_22262:183-6854(-)
MAPQKLTDNNTSLVKEKIHNVLEKIVKDMLHPVLASTNASLDTLSVCGVTLGQVLLMQHRVAIESQNRQLSRQEHLNKEEDTCYHEKNMTENGILAHKSLLLLMFEGDDHDFATNQIIYSSKLLPLPPLNRLAIVRGMCASLPDSVLFVRWSKQQQLEEIGKDDEMCNFSDYTIHDDFSDCSSLSSSSHSLVAHPIASYILEQARTSTNDAVRLSSLKGLETLLGRCKSIINTICNEIQHTFENKCHIGKKDSAMRIVSSLDENITKFVSEVRKITEEVLEITMVTWESPPCRRVGSAVPGVFRSLIGLVTVLDVCNNAPRLVRDDFLDDNTGSDGEENTLTRLARRILMQPPTRRGKYVAIQELLPVLGATKLVQLSSDVSTSTFKNIPRHERKELSNTEVISFTLVDSLVRAIGNRTNNNSAAAAELLGKVCSMLREEAIEANHGNRWEKTWVRPVARDLLSSDPTRRNRVSQFCLPLVCIMFGGVGSGKKQTKINRVEANRLLASLVYELENCGKAIGIKTVSSMGKCDEPEIVMTCEDDRYSDDTPMLDRLLLAKLEVARHAYDQKILVINDKSITEENKLSSAISETLPITSLKQALIHSTPNIRACAFAALESIVPCHILKSNDQSDHIPNHINTAVHIEAKLWIEELPYAFKSLEKEPMEKVLKSLFKLLLKMSNMNNETETNFVESFKDSSHSSLLENFVVNFLLQDLFVKQAAYPGVVLDKERFALALIDLVITFATRLDSNNMNFVSVIDIAKKKKTKEPQKKKEKKSSKKTLMPLESLENSKKDMYARILATLFSHNIMSSLWAMLSSTWDETRSAAHDLLCHLVSLHTSFTNYSSSIFHDRLPTFLISDSSKMLIKLRGTHLASSPRQREADTGARMLSVLCLTLQSLDEQIVFIKGIVLTLVSRIGMMEKMLGILDPHNKAMRKRNIVECEDQINLPTTLPLSHGLIQALRLCIQNIFSSQREISNLSPYEKEGESKEDSLKQHSLQDLIYDVASICCYGLEVSLIVVADIKHKDILAENVIEEQMETRKDDSSYSSLALGKKQIASAPLNVNTGALGANASFASINSLDQDDKSKRLEIQRTVMGTWLLTKEACATLSSVLSFYPSLVERNLSKPPINIFSRAGTLLISTLASLKHQGGAYAAHKALHSLSSLCYGYTKFFHYDFKIKSKSNDDEEKNAITALPNKWAIRLLKDILAVEVIRDSTLRRSTGYSLSFLSILRPEPSPHITFSQVLSEILRLSLPCEKVMREKSKNWLFDSHFSEPHMFTSYTILRDRRILGEEIDCFFVKEENYEARCRVHALNILRLVILDAPLASRTRPFVGDAIISALIGYDDNESWAVRNSATMAFSAAMLRVIDADKNSSNSNLENLAAIGSVNSGSQNTCNVSLDRAVVGEIKLNGNAITARELFRAYPALKTFLLSLMKPKYLLDQIHQKYCIADKTKIDANTSSFFPPLLLISRLQPASLTAKDIGCAEHDALSPFVDPVFACLNDIEHQVRIVASRAISVICTGDSSSSQQLKETCTRQSLIQRCLKIISPHITCQKENAQLNYNSLHGSLLTISSLLRTSQSHPSSYFIGDLKEAIKLIASSWSLGKFSIPPGCVAVALDIWALTNDKFSFDSELIHAAYGAIHKCEQLSLHLQTIRKDVLDLSSLASTSSKIACQSSFQIAFGGIFSRPKSDVEISQNVKAIHLLHLKGLFSSGSFDVKLNSIKIFKKYLLSLHYGTILKKNEKNFKETYEICCQIVLSTLASELKFYGSAHPPTLRRLTRCALELLHVQLSFYGNLNIFRRIPGCTADELWVFLSWILHDYANLNECMPSSECHDKKEGTNILAGNCIELSSFLLSYELSLINIDCHSYHDKENYANNSPCLIEKIRTFLRIVSILSAPMCSWKIRLSCALSISNCGLLQIQNKLTNISCTNHGKGSANEFRYLGIKLQMEALKLLQDSDHDVRLAAFKAFLSSQNIIGDNYEDTSTTTQVTTSLPLKNLEVAHTFICNNQINDCTEDFEKEELMLLLLSQVSTFFNGIEDDLSSMVEDFSYTLKSTCDSDLLNLDIGRKIFEKENPNSFEETYVSCQLFSKTFVEIGTSLGLNNVSIDRLAKEAVIRNIFDQSQFVLDQLDMYTTNVLHHHLVNDVTWTRLFPKIHGVLTVSLAILELGIIISSDECTISLVAVAQNLIKSTETLDKNVVWIHPCIREILNKLSSYK